MKTLKITKFDDLNEEEDPRSIDELKDMMRWDEDEPFLDENEDNIDDEKLISLNG